MGLLEYWEYDKIIEQYKIFIAWVDLVYYHNKQQITWKDRDKGRDKRIPNRRGKTTKVETSMGRLKYS